MTKSYTLTITTEQSRVLQSACELLGRIYMGQLHEAAHVLMGDMMRRKQSTEAIHLLQDMLRALTPLATGMQGGCYHSIHSDKISDDARIAWDIQQVLRHAAAYERNPEGGWTVNFDPPRQSGKEPLPKLEKVEALFTAPSSPLQSCVPDSLPNADTSWPVCSHPHAPSELRP